MNSLHSVCDILCMGSKTMTIDEYKKLAQADQLDLLQQEGIYIGKRKEEDKTILLYQLQSFYVEVFYKKHRNLINDMVLSQSTNILSPYLEQIKIKDIDEKNKHS